MAELLRVAGEILSEVLAAQAETLCHLRAQQLAEVPARGAGR
ncbi:hypothetical protein [Streptomyces sp. NPDC053431]